MLSSIECDPDFKSANHDFICHFNINTDNADSERSGIVNLKVQ